MANIQDIAEHTGLSTATISRYINKRPYVSKEAQLAIELAMERLDYHPNSAARSLRSGKTRRVAVILDKANHPFYAELLAGISDVAWQHSYDVLLQQSGAPQWSPALVLEQAAARSMDGLIVAVESAELTPLLSLVGTVPVVACDQAMFEAGCPQVYIDHYQSTIEGLEYLQAGGARAIACVAEPDGARGLYNCASNRFRRQAYRDFAGRDRAPVIHEVSVNDDNAKTGYELFGQLATLDPRPDAVFTGGDDIAAGLLAAAREADVAVPGELAILGFDDQPIAEVLGISTIRQPIRRMGQRAAETLMRLVAEGIDAPVTRRTRVKYHLVPRTTTRKVPTT